MAGYVPAWAAFLIGFLVFILMGIPLGVYIGWGLGEEHEREAAAAELEAEEALQAMDTRRAELVPAAAFAPPEVAHEAWLAHTEQAMALANPDPRTDSQWMADEAAKLNAYIDSLLNEHPATEELL